MRKDRISIIAFGAALALLAAVPAAAEDTATKELVDRLKSPDANVSLEDLSRANETLARLDLLLQIEDKLGQLESKRRGREAGIDMNALAMPASSLGVRAPGPVPNLPAVAPGMAQNVMARPSDTLLPEGLPAPVAAGSSAITVQRVFGTNGNYAALVLASGDPKLIHVGDKLPDGSKVAAISLSGVQVKGSGGTKTLPFSAGMVPSLPPGMTH